MQQRGLTCPGKYLRLRPLLGNRCTNTKKYGPNKRTPEIKLSNKKVEDNLSDAEFKTLAIKMLTELTELDCKMKEQMKATQSELKENVPTVTGRKLGLTSMIWKKRKKINIQPEQNEETRI